MRRRHILNMLCVTLFVGVTVVSCLIESRSNVSIEADPHQIPLHVNASDLTFGTVWAQPEYPLSFQVTNISDAPVRIEEIRSSCGCVAVEPAALTIPAADSATLTATLDLMPKGAGDGNRLRPFSATLHPRLRKDTGAPILWTLTGVVSNALAATPASLYLGDHPLTRATEAHRIRLTSVEPLSAVSARCDPKMAVVRATKATEDGLIYELMVHLETATRIGDVAFPIDIDAVTASGEELPTLRIPATGRIRPEVTAYPPEAVLGVRNLNEIVSHVFTLESASKQPFEIAAIRHDDDVISISADPSGASEAFTVAVSHHFSKIGDVQSAIEFSIVQPGAAALTIKVPIHTYVLGVGPPTKRLRDLSLPDI